MVGAEDRGTIVSQGWRAGLSGRLIAPRRSGSRPVKLIGDGRFRRQHGFGAVRRIFAPLPGRAGAPANDGISRWPRGTELMPAAKKGSSRPDEGAGLRAARHVVYWGIGRVLCRTPRRGGHVCDLTRSAARSDDPHRRRRTRRRRRRRRGVGRQNGGAGEIAGSMDGPSRAIRFRAAALARAVGGLQGRPPRFLCDHPTAHIGDGNARARHPAQPVRFEGLFCTFAGAASPARVGRHCRCRSRSAPITDPRCGSTSAEALGRPACRMDNILCAFLGRGRGARGRLYLPRELLRKSTGIAGDDPQAVLGRHQTAQGCARNIPRWRGQEKGKFAEAGRRRDGPN